MQRQSIHMSRLLTVPGMPSMLVLWQSPVIYNLFPINIPFEIALYSGENIVT